MSLQLQSAVPHNHLNTYKNARKTTYCAMLEELWERKRKTTEFWTSPLLIHLH